MRIKRALAMLLCAMLTFALCVTLLPKNALAAPSYVWINGLAVGGSNPYYDAGASHSDPNRTWQAYLENRGSAYILHLNGLILRNDIQQIGIDAHEFSELTIDLQGANEIREDNGLNGTSAITGKKLIFTGTGSLSARSGSVSVSSTVVYGIEATSIIVEGFATVTAAGESGATNQKVSLTAGWDNCTVMGAISEDGTSASNVDETHYQFVGIDFYKYMQFTSTSVINLWPSGTTAVTLKRATPYLVNQQAVAGPRTLGQGGCTAYLDASTGTLQIQGLALTGAGDTGANYHAGVYAADDLIIEVRGTNTVALPAGTATTARGIAVPTVTTGKSITLTGAGSLTVTVGNGYSEFCRALSSTSLTVNSGVTLTANVGTSISSTSYGIVTEKLVNHGKIFAAGEDAGIYCNASVTPQTSISDGWLSATGSTGVGLMLGSGATFQVNGGTVELTGAPGKSAIGPSNIGRDVRFSIGPAITNGLMGANKASATVYSAQDIVAHYKSASRSNRYLRLPANGGGGGDDGGSGAGVPKTGDGAAPGVWLGLTLLCGAGFAVCVILRRKRREASGRKGSFGG